MKKSIAMLLVFTLVFSMMSMLSACSGSEDETLPQATADTTPVNDTDNTDDGTKDTDENKNDDGSDEGAKIPGTLVYEDEYLSFYYQSKGSSDEYYCYYDLICLNKYGKALDVYSVNGVVLDGLYVSDAELRIEDLPAGESAPFELMIGIDSLQTVKMDTISEICLSFDVYDHEADDQMYESDMTFKTGESIDAELDLIGKDIHTQNNVSITLLSLSQPLPDIVWFYFYFENTNDYDVLLDVSEFTIDGVAVSCPYIVIPANCKMIDNHAFINETEYSFDINTMNTLALSYQIQYNNYDDAPDGEMLIFKTAEPVSISLD